MDDQIAHPLRLCLTNYPYVVGSGCGDIEFGSLPELDIVSPLDQNRSGSCSGSDRRSDRCSGTPTGNSANQGSKRRSDACSGRSSPRLTAFTDSSFVIYRHTVAVNGTN